MDQPTKKELASQTVISMSHRGSYDEIGSVYHELYSWAGQKGAEVTGKGMTVFLSPPSEFDWASAEYEVCLPVPSGTQGDGQVTVKELPKCTVASTTVTGPYSDIPARYTEILAWLDAQGWEIAGSPREVYIERPTSDSSGDFVTEIQFPIQST